MTDEDLRTILRAELAPIERQLGAIDARLNTIDARVSGLPLIGEAIEVLRREMRLVKAAINDMGRTNITAGEVEAMHEDIDRAQSAYIELGARLAGVERAIQELQKLRE